MSNHSILHPGILHYAYAVLRHGVYGHAALCIRMAAVFHTVGSHHQGSHPLDVSRVMIPLTQIPGSPDPWIYASGHIPHPPHPGMLHCAYAVLRHGRVRACCYAASLGCCGLYITVGSHHQGSHPLDVSRVMIPLIRIPGSLDPGSLHSTSPRAAELVRCMCVPARMGTAYAYAVLHVPCIWGNARPHAPHLRSSV